MNCTQDKANAPGVNDSDIHLEAAAFFVGADLEAVSTFLAAFFCLRGKRLTFFVAGFAASGTVGLSAVMPSAPATVPTVDPIVLATATRVRSGSGAFFFCAMSRSFYPSAHNGPLRIADNRNLP